MGEPRFSTNKWFVNKKGQRVGKGVWIDENGKVIKPGWGKFDRANKTVTQYNTDGTITVLPWKEWQEKKTSDHELKVLQNDRKYAIPYIPSKQITLTIDKESSTRKNAGATFSENLLDSIAVNAKKAGLPFSTALGIAAQESTLGASSKRTVGNSMFPWLYALKQEKGANNEFAKGISYQDTQSPSLLISNWKRIDENPFAEFHYDSKGNLRKKDRDATYYDKHFYPALWESNRYHVPDVSPLYHGFKSYKEDPQKYNHGDPSYPQKVEAQKEELTKYSPEIREYMKRNNLHLEGGKLNINYWDALPMKDKAEIMGVAIANGITTLPEIRKAYNEFAEGGYIPSDSIKKRIANWEGASMKTNRSFADEARDFNHVIPASVRNKLSDSQLDALYSYGYNVGMGNLKKRVLPALTAYTQGKATKEDVQRSMWAAKDSQLRGLTTRRNAEREMFGGNYRTTFDDKNLGVHIDPSSFGPSQTFYNNLNIQLPQMQMANNMDVDPVTIYKAPTIEHTLFANPKSTEKVAYSPQEDRLEGVRRFNTIMGMMGKDTPLSVIGESGEPGIMQYVNAIYGID